VDLLDEVGLGEVHRIKALVDEHTAGVQHRAHRPVTNQDTLTYRFAEGLHQIRIGEFGNWMIW
jgi:hypothetical protein